MSRGGPLVHAAELWCEQRAELGECPRWDGEHERLLWVDIAAGRALATDPDATELLLELPGRASALAQRTGGGLLVAADTDLVLLDARGAVERRVPVEDPGAGRVLNDAGCDAAGRLWIGSAVIDGEPASGGLFRVDAAGSRRMNGGVSMPNGIGWSPDTRRMYAVDTLPARRIDVFEFDLAEGRIGARRAFAQIEDGLPDGLTVDAEGCVWVAIWGAGEVRRFDSGGRLLARVRIPASQPSSCAFGGDGLRDLYITTARLGLGPREREREPLAGSIFVLRDAGAGQPLHRVAL